MGRLLLTAAAALACAGLAGCNGHGGTGGGGGICKPFTAPAPSSAPGANAAASAQPGAVPAAPVTDSAAALDDCLHRWGYALAASSDPANLVGEAAVAACAETLSSWNQAGVGAGQVQAPSLMTGETTNPIAEHHAFAEGRALFYVVQARAGRCSGPPASGGTVSR
jgi:hypothetical protein